MNDIFDSHAHYDDERFDDDRAEVLRQIKENGVSRVINVGCNIETSKSSIKLASENEGFYASVGIHPQDCENAPSDYLTTLEALSKDKGVVAIGEIGLDYFYEPFDKACQLRVFEEQLVLAEKLSVPVIIHTRDATRDCMSLLNKYKPEGVLHCFTNSAETAKEVVALGMYIGFTGVVTFKNARKLIEVAQVTPLDRILVETDCPYMAPEPNRGKRCQSDMIAFTATKIAEIKGIAPQELIDIATENTKRLFRIK